MTECYPEGTYCVIYAVTAGDCSPEQLQSVAFINAQYNSVGNLPRKRPRKPKRERGNAEWRIVREFVFKRDDYTCRYCGARGAALECDHALPLSRGGKSTPVNLVTACQPCNRSKRNRTPEEWRAA